MNRRIFSSFISMIFGLLIVEAMHYGYFVFAFNKDSKPDLLLTDKK